MDIQKYAQSTCESCLACCLLQLANKRLTKKKELYILVYALKFNKNDFVAGHLDYFKKSTGLKTTRYVQNKGFYNLVKKDSTAKTIHKKIDLQLIDQILTKKPLILAIDAFQLFHAFHYPHWILIFSKQRNNYMIYEPWEGVIKEISKELIKNSLDSYLNNILMAPQLITLK